jgi:hypothetical protein
VQAIITSGGGGKCRVRDDVPIELLETAAANSATSPDANSLEFETKAGESYRIVAKP